MEKTGKPRIRRLMAGALAFLLTVCAAPAGILMTAPRAHADTINVTLRRDPTGYHYGGTGIGHHYTVRVNGKTRQAYCLQPNELPPSPGNRKGGAMPDSSKVAQTMYYCYGYPGQRKLATWLKKHNRGSYASGIQFYLFCHVLLSYQYQPGGAFVGWTSAGPYTTISKSYQNTVKAAAKYVNSLEDPAGFDSSVSFGGTPAKAEWDGNAFRTWNIVLRGHSDNYVTYKVPKDMALATRGKSYRAGTSVRIRAGVPFRLSVFNKNYAQKTYRSGNLSGSLQEYTAYRITDSGAQNMAFFAVDKADTAAFAVRFGKLPPEITTKARSGDTGCSQGAVKKGGRIIDTVTYSDLDPGKTYTLKGILMDKETGKPVEGGAAEKEFTPEKAGGSVEVEFPVDASDLAGRSTVVFEDLYLGGAKVASHADISDGGQTIYFPAVKTTAMDGSTKSHQGARSDGGRIVDTVTCTNLIPGKDYTVKGRLVDRETGKTLRGVTAEKTFRAGKGICSVQLEYKIDSSELAGKTIVVYEDLIMGDVTVASHRDIRDEEQSVHYPDVRTTALCGETKSRQGLIGRTEKITDTVSYSNLIPGKEYAVKGVLMDKATGKPLEIGGKKVTAEKTFTAEKASGAVEIEFVLDSSELGGRSIVVFEDIYDGEILVAAHADIRDEGQTIVHPSVRTKAADGRTGGHTGSLGKRSELVDTVTFSGLIPGETYALKGTLMDSETGKPIMIGGKEVTAETKFRAPAASGEARVRFVFDSEALAGRKTVVFEDLEYGGVKIAAHADLKDEGQSVTYPEKPDTPLPSPQTGDPGSLIPWVIAAAAATLAAAAAWRKRRAPGKAGRDE